MKRKKKFNRFFRFMVNYALCVGLVTLILMGMLWIYLSHYEKSQDLALVKEQVSEITKKSLKKETKNLINGLDHTYQSEEEALDLMYELIHSNTSFSKDLNESTEDRVVYNLMVKKNVYGTISLEKEKGKDIFGFYAWKIEKTNYDYSALIMEDVIHIPNDWSLEVNNKSVGEEYISNYEQRYTTLNAFYGDGNYMGLPYLTEYRIGNKIGNLNVVVKDPAGKKYKKEKLDEKLFLNKCDEGTSQSIQNFMDTFLPYYIQCLSNANHDASGNFDAITPYLVPDANLYIRLYNAIEGQMWANSNGDSIVDVQYNKFLVVGNGYYLVDLTYTLETIGLQGAVQSTHNARVLLQESNGSFLACDIESY